jgi:hypothetical protein
VFAGAPYEVQLVEYLGGLVKLGGGTLTLLCSLWIYHSNYWMHLICQAPWKWLEWVSRLNSTVNMLNYAESVKGRFIRDNKESVVYL